MFWKVGGGGGGGGERERERERERPIHYTTDDLSNTLHHTQCMRHNYYYCHTRTCILYCTVYIKVHTPPLTETTRTRMSSLTFPVSIDGDPGGRDDHVVQLLPVPPRLEETDQHGQR